jgi:hypothetical protein
MQALVNYQIYSTMFKSYQIPNQKNLILEPFSCLLKLILLQYKEKGTKISIIDNSICFNEPSYSQGLIRLFNGDCREDLHNLYHPLLKCVEWYPLKEYPQFYEECKKGLELLNEVYDNNTTIHHTISHYISIINGTNKQSLPDANPIIDQLQDIWIQEEIKAISELVTLILNDKNKDIYLKSLEDIVDAKEKTVNEYIRKISTTY